MGGRQGLFLEIGERHAYWIRDVFFNAPFVILERLFYLLRTAGLLEYLYI